MLKSALSISSTNPNETRKLNLLLNLSRQSRGGLCQTRQNVTQCNGERAPGSTARYTRRTTYGPQSLQPAKKNQTRRGTSNKNGTLKMPYASRAYTPKRAYSPLRTIS